MAEIGRKGLLAESHRRPSLANRAAGTVWQQSLGRTSETCDFELVLLRRLALGHGLRHLDLAVHQQGQQPVA